MLQVDAAEVAAWSPSIHLSDGVTGTAAVDGFAARAHAGYRSPPIRFQAPQNLLVSGRHFAVVAEAGGLVAASVHTLPRFRWRQLFEPVARIGFAPDAPTLVAASAGYGNYYHWTTETIAAALMHRALCPDETIALAIPRIDQAWKRDGLQAFGITNPLVELPADQALVLEAGVLTSLTGPDHSFAPHPAMLDLMRRQLPGTGAAGPRHRRLYLSRMDAGDRRRMLNEADLCMALAALGFQIVQAGSLGVEAQAALVREAGLIVAPHGAALTNLLFAGDGDDGPAVIELFQENYLNRCFLKLCQGKRLRYRAVVNPCIDQGPHHHSSTWRTDIDLIRRLVDMAG